MKLHAIKNDKDVVIVAFLYKESNLKAVYVDDEGAIDAADADKFTVSTGASPEPSFVAAVKNIKVKGW